MFVSAQYVFLDTKSIDYMLLFAILYCKDSANFC